MSRRGPFASGFASRLQNQDDGISRTPAQITAVDTIPESIDIVPREPVPLDQKRWSLVQLPAEVLRHIFNCLCDLSTHDILTAASLCSFLYQEARYVQHRTVLIDLDKFDQARTCLDFITRRDLLPAIRRLEIRGRHSDELPRVEQEVLTRLIGMVPDMTGLRDLDWKVGRTMSVPIPQPLLDLLPARLRLHTAVIGEKYLHSGCRESLAQARRFLAPLVGSPSLCSLSVHIWFDRPTELECRRTMQALREVLTSCPNLRRLPQIAVGSPRSAGTAYPQFPPWHYAGIYGDVYTPWVGAPYCGMGLSGGQRPPALEELGVAYYPFGHDERLPPMNIYSAGYPERGSEIMYWAETFEWSRLLTLNDVPCELASAIAPKLTHLKEIVFSERQDGGDYTWLGEINAPLEVLTMPSWSCLRNRPGLITRHGATLRRLKIHQAEPWDPGSCVTAPALLQLCRDLPHLRELEIDLERGEDVDGWPYAALEAIAASSSLRTVKLWFKLGRTRTELVEPLLTVFSARHLANYLRVRSGNVRSLTLHSGAPSNWNYIGRDTWGVGNFMTFVCNMVDEGAAGGRTLAVTCPSLSKEHQVELDRLCQVDRDQSNHTGLYTTSLPRGGPLTDDAWERHKRSLPLRVAVEGPLTLERWQNWPGSRLKVAVERPITLERWQSWQNWPDSRPPEQPSRLAGLIKRVWKR